MKEITITGALTVDARTTGEDNKVIGVVKVEGIDAMQVSDGYHTMDELYDHRITLFIALAKMQNDFDRLAIASGRKPAHRVWRSKNHHKGGDKMYKGWFIMGIDMEEGRQITYHLPIERWPDTNFAETVANAPQWDGHTAEDTLERLKQL